MRFFSAGFRIWGEVGWGGVGAERGQRVVTGVVTRVVTAAAIATTAVRVPHTAAGGAMRYLEGAHEGLVHTHHGTRVIELAAIVRRRKESHQLPPSEELVPVLHDLQCTVRGGKG